MPKDFISFLDWSADDLSELVKAVQMFRQRWIERKSPPALKGRRIALMWGATGFRNRVALELGIAELGGKAVEILGTIDVNEPLVLQRRVVVELRKRFVMRVCCDSWRAQIYEGNKRASEVAHQMRRCNTSSLSEKYDW